MPPIVKDLLLSKKFIVALLTTVGSVASYLGWNVDPTSILIMMTPFLIYIGAQGWADNGKEQAKIQQETAVTMHDKAKQDGLFANKEPSVTITNTNTNKEEGQS